jgi:D-alanyl-D-alanine carboxypeptidase
VKKTDVPGATQAIITPDGFTWQGATGVSDLQSQNPMRPDDILGIASITKTFTAATVLKLVEEGTLSLDDTLGKWLPDIAKNIPDGESLTLRQLLNGTAGIFNPDGTEQYAADFTKDSDGVVFTPEEYVAYAYGKPRFSEDAGGRSYPGWTYPNTGNVLAGLMVEKATGSSLSSVMREQVLDPLGLDRTFFGPEEEIVGNQARGYGDSYNADGSINLAGDGVIDDVTDLDRSGTSNIWAAGALYSTAQDVARFSDALFSGELLSENSLKEMLTFVDGPAGLPIPEADNYGLGVARADFPWFGKVFYKGGDGLGYSSQMYYFADKGGATSVSIANSRRDQNDLPNSIVFASADTLLLNSPSVA